jgi:hypothetical protein
MTEILKDGARIRRRVPHCAEPNALAKRDRYPFILLFGDHPGKEARIELVPVTGERTEYEYFRPNAQ